MRTVRKSSLTVENGISLFSHYSIDKIQIESTIFVVHRILITVDLTK